MEGEETTCREWKGGVGGGREGGRDEGGRGTTRGAVNLYACLTVALDESLFRFVRAALELERGRERERRRECTFRLVEMTHGDDRENMNGNFTFYLLWNYYLVFVNAM